MKSNTSLSRRSFLAGGTAGIAATLAGNRMTSAADSKRPRVVRVTDTQATSWDYSVDPKKTDKRFWDYIDQDVTDKMFDKGLCGLTGTDNAGAAWRSVMGTFRPDDTVAIKINCNNVEDVDGVTTNRMDATIPLINAVLSGLVGDLGAEAGNITVFDTSRPIQTAVLFDRCRFREVRWVSSRTSDRWDRGEQVTLRDLPKPGGQYFLPKAITGAKHLINLSLFKAHDCGVTGAMKNHYGSIPSPHHLHSEYRDSGSYIGDINNHPQIRSKTRLCVCDGLFGNWHNNVWEPRAWKTFGDGSPNSLFFSLDPVALDSVLVDHIIRECEMHDDCLALERAKNHAFLEVAMDYHKLGVYELSPFRKIDYQLV